jgi:hypothetical protein
MSEFLLIVPEGWTQIDYDSVYAANGDFSESNVDNWCNTGQYSYIEEGLKASGVIGAEATVVEARRFHNHLLVRLG